MHDFDFGKDVDNLTRESRTVEQLLALPAYDESEITATPDSPNEFFHKEYVFTAGKNKFDFIIDVANKCGVIPIYIPVDNGYDLMIIRLVRITYNEGWTNSKREE